MASRSDRSKCPATRLALRAGVAYRIVSKARPTRRSDYHPFAR